MGVQRLIGAGVLALAVVATAAASAPAAARPHARAAGAVYFYANVGNPVPGSRLAPNPPRIKPSALIEYVDGSWVIVNLRWSAWGGGTARANGISSASNCTPNCATGKRSHDPARLVLSRPKPLGGRTVYTCFALTIPARPKANQHYCLARAGSRYAYRPAVGSRVRLASFLSPDKKIWCVLGNAPGSHQAFCATGNPTNGKPVPNHSATVSASGQVQLCDWAPGQNPLSSCVQNWDPSAPVLRAGSIDLIYQYRCIATASSVTCSVTTGAGKGKGFRITPGGVTKLTP